MFEHIGEHKLQRMSILKSTLDDIQHFEIMFQLENQMRGVEECLDLFWQRRRNISEKFWIESMAYKRQLWMSHCMKMFSINVLLSKPTSNFQSFRTSLDDDYDQCGAGDYQTIYIIRKMMTMMMIPM